MINKIIAETGVKIDIEDDGRVAIATSDDAAAAQAKRMIMDIVREIKVGDVYLGKVTRLMQFGAFVELLPGKEGMVHISKLSNKRVEKIEDFCKVGDEMLVRVNEIDEKKRVNLIHRGVRWKTSLRSKVKRTNDFKKAAAWPPFSHFSELYANENERISMRRGYREICENRGLGSRSYEKNDSSNFDGIDAA